MNQRDIPLQENIASLAAAELETETIIESDSFARRAQFTLGLSRFMGWGIGVMAVLMLIVWLFAREYTQILLSAVVLTQMVVGSGLYHIFYRQEKVVFGQYLFMISFLILVAVAPILIPVVAPAASVGYVVLIAVSILILGGKNSIWMIATCLAAYAIDLILINTSALDWFKPLSDEINLITALSIGVIGLTIGTLMIRLIVVGQEQQFREARRANFEVERRAKTEQEQGEQLRQANLEIESRMANEQAQREYLQNLIAQIQITANRLAAAATEIQAAATQQVATAAEQDTTVTQTVATMEEVRSAVSATAERAQSVAEASQQSVNISRAGEDTVADTIEGMKMIQQRVESIAETILMLSERTQQIGEIIDTVNALADQSKLLALNASIEAARAGEEGKGFAVVAMEVRQLAEQSREATSRVRDILSDIQKATNTAVMVTEEGSKGADAGMEQVEMAGIAIRELAQTLEEAAQAAMQIAASTHQQTNGMDQLTAAMTQIKQASTQTAAGMRQTEQSVRDLMEMAQELEEATTQYVSGSNKEKASSL
jgi:methyl-accepting chemotaxis protein